jgi:hypothetical protein
MEVSKIMKNVYEQRLGVIEDANDRISKLLMEEQLIT